MANSTLTGQQIVKELAELATSVLSGVKVEENVLARYTKDFGGKPGFQPPAGARINGKEVEVLNAKGNVLATFRVSSDGNGSWEQNKQASAAPSAPAAATTS